MALKPILDSWQYDMMTPFLATVRRAKPIRRPLVALMQILPVIALGLAGDRVMAIEEPDYRVVRQTPDFELRRYEAKILAETEVPGPFDKAGNRAFCILADYIFGANQTSRKIAMTAPVSQRPATGDDENADVRIEMTALVTQRPKIEEPETYVVSFVIPERFALDSVPKPNDSRITLREEPGRLVAARRYSGRWTESRYRREGARLLAAVRGAGLIPTGRPVYARYNSPFSLPFLRRNEVMVEVSDMDD